MSAAADVAALIMGAAAPIAAATFRSVSLPAPPASSTFVASYLQ